MATISGLAGLLSAGVVIVPAASAAATPRLAGTTTITASHTSREIVDLPHPVRIPTTPGDNHIVGLTISGPGRLVGLALASAPRATTVGFVELRVRDCHRAACTMPASTKEKDQRIQVSWGQPFPGFGNKPPPSWVALPAGSYQLSVFTDGAPLRLRWHIPGLSGRSDLQPRLQQHSQVLTPPERGVGGDTTPISSQASGIGSVSTDVTVLGSVHSADYRAHVSNEVWWCIYQDAGPPGGVMTSGCPGGSAVGFGGIYLARSFRGLSYAISVSTGPAASGTYFQGVDDTGAQIISDVHDNLLWADAGIPAQHE